MRVTHFAKTFAWSLICTVATLSATPVGWSTPEVIDNTTNEVYIDITTCYNNTTNQIFATWGDSSNNQYPTYAIASYVDGQWSWSAPATMNNMSTSSVASANVYSCYSSATNQMIAVWADSNNSNYPTYSIASYTGGTWNWSPPAPLAMEAVYSEDGTRDVFVSYNAETNQVFATWSNTSTYPTYSIASYDGSSWTWSTSNTISTTTTATVWNHLFTCYASQTNQMIATWENDDSLEYAPIYSIASYDGSNWTWSTPAIIDNTTGEVVDDVTISYNAITNQVFAAWTDGTTQTPIYSIGSYAGGTWVWSTPAVIDNTSSQVSDNIFTCFNSVNNQMFATWNDHANGYPTYAIASYAQGSWVWSAPAVIDNYLNSVENNVHLCYDSFTNQVFAIWGDGHSYLPIFAFYTGAFVLYDINRFRAIYEHQLEKTREALRNSNL